MPLDQLLELRDYDIVRNLYLYDFEISALRGFGKGWARLPGVEVKTGDVRI
jgi:hypothetical protein